MMNKSSHIADVDSLWPYCLSRYGTKLYHSRTVKYWAEGLTARRRQPKHGSPRIVALINNHPHIIPTGGTFGKVYTNDSEHRISASCLYTIYAVWHSILNKKTRFLRQVNIVNKHDFSVYKYLFRSNSYSSIFSSWRGVFL